MNFKKLLFPFSISWSMSLLTLTLLMVPGISPALETQVLSNFNQPSSGGLLDLSVADVQAIPFHTDADFTEFDGVELTVTTLFLPGLFFVEVWDVDAFAQPDNVVAVLSGPSAPAGLTRYTVSQSLQPNTSYFLVFGLRNGGSEVYVDSIDANGSDSQPAPIYQFGTDINGDNIVDLVNRCRGRRASDYVTISWSCGQAIATRFFPKLRFLAEEPRPPADYSLTATPLSVDFGLVPAGSTAGPVTVTLLNDGNVDQTIEGLNLPPDSRFSILNDACTSMVLSPMGNCTFGVTFTPDHSGLTTGTIVIPTSDDPRSPYGLPLVGQSDEPITLPPDILDRTSAVPISPWTGLLLAILLMVAIPVLKLRP